jgi:hypothetical protein
MSEEHEIATRFAMSKYLNSAERDKAIIRALVATERQLEEARAEIHRLSRVLSSYGSDEGQP